MPHELSEIAPRTRDWRRWQLAKRKRQARQRIARWNITKDVEWIDRRFVRRRHQMRAHYKVGKRVAYPYGTRRFPTTLPWYLWQHWTRRGLWNISLMLRDRPRRIGRFAVTRRECACYYCRNTKTRRDGPRHSELRRTWTVDEQVEIIFQERDDEVEAAYAEAMLLDMQSLGEDWYEEALGYRMVA